MKAILFTKYGPPEVLQLSEIDKPTPNENQVLVKVIAASVNIADWHTMHGGPVRFMGVGLRKPKDQRFGTDIPGGWNPLVAALPSFSQGMRYLGLARVVLPSMQLPVKSGWY